VVEDVDAEEENADVEDAAAAEEGDAEDVVVVAHAIEGDKLISKE
jgi:hypothetical protein